MEAKFEIVTYDGMLLCSGLQADRADAIRAVFKSQGLDIEISGTGIEFTYSGRDSNRWVVGLLKQLAAILVNADGEIVCELTTAADDSSFEFYSVSNGKLFSQSGKIVRGQRREV